MTQKVESILLRGDCLSIMPGLPDNSIDTVITDPPYGLSFMGRKWDYDVPSVTLWKEVLRVLKPGGTMLCFAGSRTQHRMAVNVEDAGWEIRDTLFWVYGSGFPKALDVSKAIDADACRKDLTAKLGRAPTKEEFKAAWEGWRKVVGVREDFAARAPKNNFNQFSAINPSKTGINSVSFAEKRGTITSPTTADAALWNGWKTALKPAVEPIIVAMKPLDGTFAENALRWGVAGLNIDGGRIGTNEEITNHSRKTLGQVLGRFPANIILDEEAAVMLDEQSGPRQGCKPHIVNASLQANKNSKEKGWGSITMPKNNMAGFADSGGASRFFYTAKASKAERNEGCEGLEEKENNSYGEFQGTADHAPKIGVKKHNHHPTVKPLALMEYLCRLTKTPTGGVVLDPFAGSGTTGVACLNTGRHSILIEKEPEYWPIIEARLAKAGTVV